jgi:hypothetical protein
MVNQMSCQLQNRGAAFKENRVPIQDQGSAARDLPLLLAVASRQAS